MKGSTNPKNAIRRIPEIERLGTQMVLQTKARLRALPFEYFKPLNEQSVHSEQCGWTHRKGCSLGVQRTYPESTIPGPEPVT